MSVGVAPKTKKLKHRKNTEPDGPKRPDVIATAPNEGQQLRHRKTSIQNITEKGRTISPKEDVICQTSHVNPYHAHDGHL